MTLFSVLALAFALAFDAFAVAVAVGIRLGKMDRWTVFRLSFHFGFAQFGMPIIGWRAGEVVARYFEPVDHWFAGLILFGIGAKLFWEQVKPEAQKWDGDPTRGLSLLVLMLATSVDALAAGLSLALSGADILMPSLVIGVVASVMTVTGLVFGRAFSLRFSRVAGIVGAIMLIGLAIKTVWTG